MQFSSRFSVQAFVFALAMVAFQAVAADSPREHLSLDANWKFHLGDNWPNALRLDKAGSSTGPAAEKFNDSAWRTINLPHDWAIELPFDKNADASHGFKPVGPGFPHNSIGWYRRTFDLPSGDSGKRIWLDFDGVFRDTTVWVNGWIVGHHESGYYPFRYDITDIVKFGGKNTIAVRVDASKFEGWFYEGAGIYRHVWLDETAPVAIAPDGIYVSTRFKINREASKILRSPVLDGPAKINVIVDLLNDATNQSWQFPHEVSQEGKPNWEIDASMKYKIVTPNGETNVVENKSPEMNSVRLLTSKGVAVATFDIDSPELWSPENPKLYKLITTVSVDDKIVDQKETTFGIRTVAFDPTNGFLLNGKHYELKGTCNHQDMAGVGEALPDALQYFRIKTLKKFGCNAYRTSHNPPTPELLDACDRLGMIVMDENRLLGSDEENLRRWETQIRRDRNHSSVCIWSIANEESAEDTPQAANVARTMQNLVKSLDPTRPVTYAGPRGDDFQGIDGVIEVRGWNYHPGPEMDKYHAEHPTQPEVGTEQGSTVSTRGIYENDTARGYVSAYDVNHPDWATTAETWWSFFDARPWLSGGFVWTGFDYRGEPTPYGWPCINSHFGILDMCGFPKDNFYYYQTWWTTNTVLHLLPHWDWPGKEGQDIDVWAYSNCKEVELFLNGKSLGRQTMPHDGHLAWQVKYQPGTLSAKGYDADGKVIAETKEETTGNAAAIQLTPDRSTINADGEDVSVIKVSALDAQGRAVPVSTNLIHFELSGPGKILGVGNGDPSCHEPDTFIAQPSVKTVLFNDWRWKLAELPARGASAPEYAADFDDAAWEQTSSAGEDTQLKEGQSAVFRQHLQVTAEQLAQPDIEIQFGRIDDNGWVFVNGRRVGESHDWQDSPVYPIKNFLHEGDNVIAVGVRNESGDGGLVLGMNVEFVRQPVAPAWSRSLFNGLAEILVQSTQSAGEIRLTASADDLQPATVSIQTSPCTPRPSMP
jgi:beta-galactosidase